MLADLVVEGARTLVFVRSRRGAELTALAARRWLADVDDGLRRPGVGVPGAATCRRSGGRWSVRSPTVSCSGVASTNALELGVDIAGLDAVVVAGFPGTRASFWQQAGRAGRAGRDALVVLLARDDPLDTYLVHHPQALLGAPVESCVLDPGNPYLLRPQLACAAAELPLTEADLVTLFGGGPARELVDEMVADGTLRRRPAGWFWPSTDVQPSAEVDIRGSGGDAGGRRRAGDRPDAGHGGRRQRPGRRCTRARCTCTAGRVTWSTSWTWTPGWRWCTPRNRTGPPTARSTADVAIVSTDSRTYVDGVQACVGTVDVTVQVVCYLRRLPTGEVIETVPLELPAQTLRTRAVWYVLEPSRARPGPSSRRRGFPVRCTPPSTPRSGCCRCSRCATDGTSVGCPPRCTRTPVRRRCSCTTDSPAAPASPIAGSPRSPSGWPRPGR